MTNPFRFAALVLALVCTPLLHAQATYYPFPYFSLLPTDQVQIFRPTFVGQPPTLMGYQSLTAVVTAGSGGGGGGGSGSTLSRTITQANSFTIGECVYNNNGTWAAADNSAIGTATVAGVVTTTGNPFTVTYSGYENTITGLAANTQYYLGTAGGLTTTPPTTTTSFVVSVLNTGVAGDGTVAISAPASNALVTVPSGGTGISTATAHGVLIGEATSPFAVTSAGSSGQVLTSNGASADPTFQAPAGGITGSGLVNHQVAVASGAGSITSFSSFTSDSSGNLVANSLVTGNTVIGFFAPNLIGTNSGPLLLSSSNGHVLINTGSALGYVATTGNQGTFTLASGVATVSNTFIDANSIIVAWLKPGGRSGTITGPLYYPTTTAGTGFTVAEAGGVTDNSTYNYIVVLINQ